MSSDPPFGPSRPGFWLSEILAIAAASIPGFLGLVYASLNARDLRLTYWNPGSLACSVMASLILCVPLGLSLLIRSAPNTGVRLFASVAIVTVVVYYVLGYSGPRLGILDFT